MFWLRCAEQQQFDAAVRGIARIQQYLDRLLTAVPPARVTVKGMERFDRYSESIAI